MQDLNFPSYSFRIRSHSAGQMIWDSLRKKWLVLTPEEWVRQHLIVFLMEERGYPSGLMMPEHRLKVNQLERRADLVVFNHQGLPIFMAECKRPNVTLDQKTLDQIARYNLALGVPFLLITNGLNHYCLAVSSQNQTTWLTDIPNFNELSR